MKSHDQLLLHLGQNRTGTPSTVDLLQTPHLILTGHSSPALASCLESLLHSLCQEHRPQVLSLLAIDLQSSLPEACADLPNLLRPVATDLPEAMEMLTWLSSEMKQRFDLLAQSNCPNLAVYNARRQAAAATPLPRILIATQNVEILLRSATPELESSLHRLVAMSRAVGIHVILATSEPKSLPRALTVNIPLRITCQEAPQPGRDGSTPPLPPNLPLTLDASPKRPD